MRKMKTVLILGALVFSLLTLFATVPAASGADEWADADLVWYYENLDDTDRKKIRQAFDYCIPRAQVIEGLMKGLAVPLATYIGQNIVGYDDSVQPRAYNTTKALALMTDVFGKEYTVSYDANETYTEDPYFSMVLVSPTTNVARTQWAALINFALTNIGVDTTLKWWNWNIIMPRLFLDPIQDPVGADYHHGGYDAYFVGFAASADPDYSSFYFPTQFAPAGNNAQYIDNDDLTEIVNRSLVSLELADRLKALSDFQKWYYEWVPQSLIRQQYDLYGVDKELIGLDTYRYGRYSWVSNITIPDEDTFRFTTPGDFVDFNYLMTNSWYDVLWQSNVYLPLLMRRGHYNLSHLVGCLAESWTSSADKLEWTVKLKKGVLFEDGEEVTATDVKFSYDACFYPANPNSGFMTDRFGANATDKIVKVDEYTVKFILKSFYPFVESGVLTFPILPEHQLSLIEFADWKTDDTNVGTTAIKANGPYKFDSYSVTDGVKLVPNDKYNETKFQDADPSDDVGGPIWQPKASFSTVFEVVVKEATTAVIGLGDGTYDCLDPQTGIFAQYDIATEGLKGVEDTTKIIKALEYGWQELAYNHYDPRWGLNAKDPREMYPGDYEKAPFDLTSVFFGILLLATIQIIRTRKKKN